MNSPNGEPSLGSLFSTLASDTSILVRKEVELGVSEMTTKAKAAALGAGSVVVGGAVALVGGFALVAAAVLALAMVLPPWLAALLVGAALVGIGGAMSAKALAALRAIDPVPRLTAQTLRDDKAWIKEQVG